MLWKVLMINQQAMVCGGFIFCCFYFYFTHFIFFYAESQPTKSVIKTEKQNKSDVATWPDLSRFTNVTIYDLKLHLSLLKEYSAKQTANKTSEAVSVKEEHETESDATVTNEDDDHSAASGQLLVDIHFIL